MSDLEFWKDLGGIFDAVMNYQKKNVEFNQRFINPWIRLGNIFDREDQANDAVQAYQRAVEIDPNSAQNWNELGDAQFKKGDHEQAVDSYSRAVMLDPEAGWPLGNLALTLVTQGRVEEAIPLYKKSIDLLTEVKDKAICWNRLGNAYRKLNDYENAFMAFQKADQLDGENTGFNDKLDETPPSTTMIAPEEILEQMMEDRPAETPAPEAISAPVEEVAQPEVEPAAENPTVIVTADGQIGIAPNTEMKVEETASEEIPAPVSEAKVEEAVAKVAEIEPEEIPAPVSEVSVEEPVMEVAAAEPEEVPAPVSEVKVEETVTEVVTVVSEIKIEETVTEIAAPVDESKAEEPVAEIPAGTEEEETPLTLHEKKFDLLQVVESVIEKVEKAYAENKKQKAVEEAPAEAELPGASEEPALEVEALTQVNEDIRPEAMPIAQIVEGASPEPVAEEAETPVASEEVTQIVELTEKVAVEVSDSLADDLSEEELAQRNETRRAPAWLKIKAEKKIEEKVTTDENGTQQEVTQVESVTVLSEIPQEASVSDTVEKMEIVETYTDPLAAQLTTEPSLSEEPIHSEATEQIEVPAKQEAEAEAQEPVAVEESTVAEEVSVASDEETLEAAYEEYLKDSAEPDALKDHVDALQDDTPLTKVGKNGEVRIAMDTKNAHVWNELGNIYLNAGTFDEAIASYSKAIELDRQFAWPYSNLALAYVQKGRFAEAILLYQRGIELFTSDRDKAVTWNRLGNVYRRIHDYKNAIASYQTADELDPENATLSLRNSFGLLEKMYSDSKPAYAPQ